MPPQTASRLTPEIMQALMARRAGGAPAGGTTIPANQQVMAPNSYGGPVGPSQTPLPTSPQAVPAGTIPQSMPSSAQGAPQVPPSPGSPAQGAAAQGGGLDPGSKVLAKALLSRLVSNL